MPPAWLVVLSGVIIAMHVGKMPPAIPVLQQALGVTLVQAGFLLSAVQLAGMCLGVLAGMSADRLGLRRSLLTGQAILATASLCGMVVSSPTGLLLLRALEGLGFLLAALPAPSLIRQLVRPSQLPLYLGLWSTYMGTGIALALLAGPLAMQALGWQGWWGLLGLLSAAMALCIVWVIPSDQARASTAAASAPPPAADPPAAWWAPLALTLRHRVHHRGLDAAMLLGRPVFRATVDRLDRRQRGRLALDLGTDRQRRLHWPVAGAAGALSGRLRVAVGTAASTQKSPGACTVHRGIF